MGNKLTKTKTTSIKEETIEQEQIIPVTTDKFIEKKIEKTTKKKKDNKSKTNGSKSKVDQSTNTDHYLLISSSEQKHLVGNQPFGIAAVPIESIPHPEQINSAYQSESNQNDVEQLRQICIQNGIISERSNDLQTVSSNETKNSSNFLLTTVENEENSQRHLEYDKERPSIME